MTRIATMLATAISSITLGTSAIRRSAEDPDLERQRQRADRPLRRAVGQRSRCHRSCRRRGAAADRRVHGRSRLPADGRADDEARPGASRTDRLPPRPRHRRLRLNHRTRPRARQCRPQDAGLARLPPHRRRRTLPHEFRRSGQRGRPLLRPVPARFGPRPRATRPHRRGRRRPLPVAAPQHADRPRLTTSRKDHDMAQIGSFIRTRNGFSGRLRTLSLDIEVDHRSGRSFRRRERSRTTAFTPATRMDQKSAPAGPAPARRRANTSLSRSTTPVSRSRSAPTCSSPAAIAPPSICSGPGRQSAKPGADPCHDCDDENGGLPRTARRTPRHSSVRGRTQLIPPSRSRSTRPSRAAAVKGGRRPALAPCP